MYIDRKSPIPLYYQLKQILMHKIEQGEWQVGDMLPSEQELQTLFNVSRTTVRQTLGELEHEGYLLRQRGRGTFIAEPERAQAQQLDPGWEVLENGMIDAPDMAAQMLRIRPGAPVYYIHRLRTSAEGPVGRHQLFVPEQFAHGINHSKLTEGDALAYVRDLPQAQHAKVQRSITAVPAGDDEVKWLDLQEGEPVLRIKRLLVADDGTAIEFLHATYRGDRFTYQTKA